MNESVDGTVQRPPVRRVRLAIWFESESELTLSAIDGLISQWRVDYPLVTEFAPAPYEDDDDLPMMWEPGADWRLPMVTLDSRGDGRSLILQGDRIGLDWQFEEGASHYPGYDLMSSELMLRFEQVRARLLTNEPDFEIKPKKAELVYRNEIGSVGVLGAIGADVDITPTDHDGFMFQHHYHWGVRGLGNVQLTSGAFREAFTITQELSISEDVGVRAALDACHRECGEAFETWSRRISAIGESK